METRTEVALESTKICSKMAQEVPEKTRRSPTSTDKLYIYIL